MAWARLGDGRAAVRLLTMMNPIELARGPQAVAHYRGEPYVLAGDVSCGQGRVGQSGWTWYTGSAAWMYRIWIEEILGFQLRGNKLALRPVIPDDWPGFEITYRYRSAVYQITVERASSNSKPTMSVDGAESAQDTLELLDDHGSHKVTVRIPLAGASQADEGPATISEAFFQSIEISVNFSVHSPLALLCC